MKLKVLVDNNTFINEYYFGEPGVSYYIEDEDTKILFDVGYSDAFLTNAKLMNINLNNINKLVISHGHDDHTRGLKYFFKDKTNIELIAHPKSFNYKEDKSLSIGSPITLNELDKYCVPNLTESPIKISDNIYFLGYIPASNDFEMRKSIGKYKENDVLVNDFIEEDSAIVYKNKNGIFVITGCSHSGICNIIEYAKKVCNDDRVIGVIGGFHLFDKDERLYKTIDYLKKQNIKYLYPCHCVSLQAKIEMAKEIEINEVGVGLEINI